MSDEVEIIDEEDLLRGERAQRVSDEDILEGDELDRALDMLEEEYKEAESQLTRLKPKWDKWRRQRLAKPEQETKNWPWPNASNVSVPVTRIITQTLFGMIKAAMMRRDPVWTVRALRDEERDKEVAKVISKYFDIISKSETDLNLKSVSNTIFMDGSLLGYCWTKVPWLTEERVIVTENEDGVLEKQTMVSHDGPSVMPCQPEDILFNRAWSKLEDVPAFFQDVHVPWHEMTRRFDQGIYDGGVREQIEDWARESVQERDEARAERLGYDFARIRVWDLTECFFYWDVDGDGVEEFLKFTVHLKSRTVLRQEYETLGVFPYEPVNFVFEPFNVEGTGTGLACEHMQDEADAIHNMRNDNMKISNQKIFLASKSGSIKPNEQLYPGKLMFVDDPSKDFQAVSMGEQFGTSLNAENMTLMYAQKATGVSDAMGGFADQTMKTRDSGVSQQIRLQQGTGLFGAIMENMVESFSRIGRLIFMQLVANRDRVIRNEMERRRLTEGDIELLREALSVPLSEITTRLSFSIRTTDVEQTFEVKRQNVLTLSQLYMQYGQQVAPLAQQLFGPTGKQMMAEAPDLYQFFLSIYTGSTKLLGQIFQFFGEDDDEQYLPDIRKAEMVQQLMQELNDQMMQMREVGGVQGPGAPMGGVPGIQANQPTGSTGSTGAEGLGGGMTEEMAGGAIEPGM